MSRGPGSTQRAALEALQEKAVLLKALGLELTAQPRQAGGSKTGEGEA